MGLQDREYMRHPQTDASGSGARRPPTRGVALGLRDREPGARTNETRNKRHAILAGIMALLLVAATIPLLAVNPFLGLACFVAAILPLGYLNAVDPSRS